MPAGERALVNVAEDIKWKRKRGVRLWRLRKPGTKERNK